MRYAGKIIELRSKIESGIVYDTFRMCCTISNYVIQLQCVLVGILSKLI